MICFLEQKEKSELSRHVLAIFFVAHVLLLIPISRFNPLLVYFYSG